MAYCKYVSCKEIGLLINQSYTLRTRVCICLGSSCPSLWPQMALFDFSLMMTRLIWVTCFRFQLTDSCLFSFLCVFRLLFHVDTNQLWSTGHSSKDWYWKCQWSDSSLPNYIVVIVLLYFLFWITVIVHFLWLTSFWRNRTNSFIYHISVGMQIWQY